MNKEKKVSSQTALMELNPYYDSSFLQTTTTRDTDKTRGRITAALKN